MSSTAYWNQMYANACDAALPSAKYRPRLFIDGNQWCALFGDNIQDGVAGFGESPEMAYFDFDRAWCESLKTHNDKAQGAGGGIIAGGSPGAAGCAAKPTE